MPLVPYLARLHESFSITTVEIEVRTHARRVRRRLLDSCERLGINPDTRDGFRSDTYLIRPRYWCEYERYVQEIYLAGQARELHAGLSK